MRLPVLATFLLAILALAPANLPADEALQRPVDSVAAANDVMEAAHLAYQRGDTELAMRLYERVAQAGYGTAQVWTNAGTAAFRSGDTGRAVLFYARALRTDPEYRPARQSLEFVSPATNEETAFIAGNLPARFLRQVSPATWFLGAQLFYIVVCFALARVLASADRDTRGHWLAVFGWCLAITVVLGGVGYAADSVRRGGSEAVVLLDRSVARSEPSHDSVAKLELPAGTIVRLLESPRAGFVRFELGDGRTGFLSTDLLEGI